MERKLLMPMVNRFRAWILAAAALVAGCTSGSGDSTERPLVEAKTSLIAQAVSTLGYENDRDIIALFSVDADRDKAVSDCMANEGFDYTPHYRAKAGDTK